MLDWEIVTDDKLRGIIKMTGPDKDVHAGKNFLLLLLERGGKEKVIEFIERSRKALSDGGSLDLSYDFTPAERELFKKAALNYLSRAEFFGTVGWALPGAYSIGAGLLDYWNIITGKPRPLIASTGNIADEQEKLIQAVADEVMRRIKAQEEGGSPTEELSKNSSKYVSPAMEMLIGGSLINEGIKIQEELKLEQISDAISQVADAVEKLAEKIKAEDRQRS